MECISKTKTKNIQKQHIKKSQKSIKQRPTAKQKVENRYIQWKR